MLIDVTACGYEGAWHFPGSRTFATWAQNRPWCREGGLCVLRTADNESNDLLFSSIRRTLHGLHGDGRQFDLRLLPCEPELEDGGPLGTILANWDINPALGFIQAREAIRMKLLDRHAVFVLYEHTPLPINVWDRFAQQMEDLRKASEQVGLCAIVLDASARVQAQPTCDFTSGQLIQPVLGLNNGGLNTNLWPAYLHQRACWDAGGSLRYMHQLSQHLLQAAPGDDDQVEKLLQQHAQEALEQTQAIILLARYLENAPGHAAAMEDLKAQRLLWSPLGSHGWSIVPWAARALLAQGYAGQKIWTLRHSLVCAPLAAEIFSVCQHIEAQIRSELHDKGKNNPPGDETKNSYQRFIEDNSESTIYPPAYPSRPILKQDVWAFASLGETIYQTPQISSDSRTAYQKVQNLRNTIVHGHYVCWAHVKQAAKAAQRFRIS